MTPLQTEQLLFYMLTEIPPAELTDILGVSRQTIWRMRNNLLERGGINAEISKYHSCIKALQGCSTDVTEIPVEKPVSESAPIIANTKVLEGKVRTPKKRSQKSSWRVVPTSWEPNIKHKKLAEERCVNFDTELQKFREWEFKTPKVNADMAFMRWLRNAKVEHQDQGSWAL